MLQASHSVVFFIYKIQLGLSVKTLKMFSFYIYQLNKSSTDLTHLVFIVIFIAVSQLLWKWGLYYTCGILSFKYIFIHKRISLSGKDWNTTLLIFVIAHQNTFTIPLKGLPQNITEPELLSVHREALLDSCWAQVACCSIDIELFSCFPPKAVPMNGSEWQDCEAPHRSLARES